MAVNEVRVLKVDKDCHISQDWIKNYIEVIAAVCKRFGVTVNSIKICPSKRKGVHFYIEITPPIEAEFANRLQWLLGDDCQRVDFNRARIESSLNEWNKLFEVVGRKLTTIYRRRRSSKRSPNVSDNVVST